MATLSDTLYAKNITHLEDDKLPYWVDPNLQHCMWI